MAIREPVRTRPPLGVFRMALALVIAAFLGAALGLVWQSSGLGDPDGDVPEASSTQDGGDVNAPRSG